jgi:protein TonB
MIHARIWATHARETTQERRMQNPTSPTSRSHARAWMPSRRALLAVGAAFAAGLLLFLALWLDMRDNNSFYRTVEAPRSLEGQVFAPLPVPAPAGEEGHLARGDEDQSPAEGQPAPTVAPAPAAPPVATAPPPAPMPTVPESAPRLLSSPAPRYPRDAQRRGIGGTVLLRVHVGPDGAPAGIDLVQGSGSHSLDRAAVEAVRRWRFAPAMRDGQPVEAAVQVPITFNVD